MAHEKILIVDDQARRRETLVARGCQAPPAGDGQETVARATFDFVITDLKPPDRDGLAIQKEFKLLVQAIPIPLPSLRRVA